MFMVYYKYKLVRFTGVPLEIVECGDYIKNKNGLKQNNVPRGWARNSEKRDRETVSFLWRIGLNGDSETSSE